MAAKVKAIELTRQQVLDYHAIGWSYRRIAKQVGRSLHFVAHSIKKWEESRSLSDNPRSGRPPILDEREKRRLFRQLDRDRAQTAYELQKNTFGVEPRASTDTIYRVLRKKGFHKYLADVVPRLTYLQQLRRRKWAREFRNYNWAKVAFSDEKRFAKRPDGPIKVWRLPGEQRDPRCTRKRVKHQGGGIMVWGAIAKHRKFPLIRVNGTLGAEEYISQILTKFVPQLSRATSKRLILMQDGASAHTASATKNWLAERSVNTLSDWPANSPDANPIEHVWAYLERRLQKRDCSTDDELWDLLQKEWNKVPMSYIEKLYNSMPNRLKAMRTMRGCTTKY